VRWVYFQSLDEHHRRNANHGTTSWIHANLTSCVQPWEKAALEAQLSIPGAGAESSQPGRYSESRVGSSPVVNTDLTIGSGSSSSSEPWWRAKGDSSAVPSSSSLKITEVEPAAEVNIGQASSSSSSAQNGGGRAGWVPPSVPVPVYPGAEEAIRRPKPPPGAAPVQTSGAAENVSGASSSSSFLQDESLQAESPASGSQSNPEGPEHHIEEALEQEPDYLEKSLVEPNRTFKDVVQEGDEQ
jgi:hypothetical protein